MPLTQLLLHIYHHIRTVVPHFFHLFSPNFVHSLFNIWLFTTCTISSLACQPSLTSFTSFFQFALKSVPNCSHNRQSVILFATLIVCFTTALCPVPSCPYLFFCSHSSNALPFSATAHDFYTPSFTRIYSVLPKPHSYNATYILGTLVHYISELLPLFSTISTSPHFIFSTLALLVCPFTLFH